MPKTWTHRKPCRLCNSRRVLPALKYAFTSPDTSFVRADGSTDFSDKIPIILSLCEKCKLVQMQDVVEPNLLFRNNLHLAFPGPALESHFEEYAQDAVTRAHLRKGDLVVDIGSGDGTLLRIFKKMGMNVIGVDPSEAAAQRAKNDDIPHYRELFSPNLANEIREKHGPAALLTANYALGSIDNLHAVAAGVRFLLKQQGLLYFEEPYLADMLAQNQFDLIHHERLSMLTATPLEPFFRSTLMHFIDARRNDFRHGSLRGIVQRSDGPHVVAPTLAALLTEEQKTNLHSMDTLNAFVTRVEDLKSSIKKMVQDVKDRGGRVAGYGASGRAVTFIYECGWNEATLDCIFDDNPAKQGLKMPGTEIPVVSAKTIQERKPDVVVLFAFNDAERILKQHETYRKSGGKFIVPFPSPALV